MSAVVLIGGVFHLRPLPEPLPELDSTRPTPAVELRDDLDYVPIESKFLLSQHFSAIAAAGPIVGPILAGVMFGWLPALLWILVGSIFIGGVHDMTALTASIRHKARSIAEVVRDHMSQRSYMLFLMFIWIALVYIIVAFTDITAVVVRRRAERCEKSAETESSGDGGHRHVVAAVSGAADRHGTVAALHATVARLGDAHFRAAGGRRDLGRPEHAARHGHGSFLPNSLRRPERRKFGMCCCWAIAWWRPSCRCGCCCSRAAIWAATSVRGAGGRMHRRARSAATPIQYDAFKGWHSRRRPERRKVFLRSCSSRSPAARAPVFTR